MKAWQVTRFGAPSEALTLNEIDQPHPGPREVLVKASCTVLNYNEVDGCRGRYLTVNPPIPYTLGMEVVGTVVAAGAGAEKWLDKRVMSTAQHAYGAHAEFSVCGMDMTFDAPASLDDVRAAAFFFPFHLAHLGLHERGRVQTGETVLIHAAAGGVGSAAVQLAKAAGARVIATAGSEDKLAFCRDLGADVAVNYRTQDIVDACNEATDGHGVDLVFDGVGGDVTQASLRAMARNGRLMIIGFASGIEAEEVPSITPRQFCFGQFSVGGVLLSYRDDVLGPRKAAGFNVTPRAVGDQIEAHLTELLASRTIKPIVSRAVSYCELPAALNAMEARQTIGRVVVEW